MTSINKTDGSYTFSDKFHEVVDKLKTKRTNSSIFGSSEYLINYYPRGDKGCSSVRKSLLGKTTNGEKYWKLHIVFTYRRLYDTLPSGWNQIFKYHRKNGLPIKIGHTVWPEDGGNHIIPLYEWLHEHLDDGNKKDFRLVGYNSWKSCSDSISVVNYHDTMVYPPDGTEPVKAGLTTNFVCNGIIGASHTCSFLLQENLPEENYNPSFSSLGLDMDLLAVHVHKSGLIPKVWKREEVTQKIITFATSNETRLSSLPMRCPNKNTLQRLYDVSLNFEEAVLASDTENKMQQRMNFDVGWKKALKEMKFCGYDPVEIAKREEWKIFFAESF